MVLVLQLVKGSWFRGSVKDFCNENPSHLNYLDMLDRKAIEIKIKDNITIGRSKENIIILDMANVSGKHAVLFKTGGIFKIWSKWYLSDVGSKNGTYIIRNNDIVLTKQEPQRIEKGDKLVFGNNTALEVVSI